MPWPNEGGRSDVRWHQRHERIMAHNESPSPQRVIILLLGLALTVGVELLGRPRPIGVGRLVLLAGIGCDASVTACGDGRVCSVQTPGITDYSFPALLGEALLLGRGRLELPPPLPLGGEQRRKLVLSRYASR